MFSQTKLSTAIAVFAICTNIATAQSEASKKKPEPAQVSKASGDVKKATSDSPGAKAMKAAQQDILQKWANCNAMTAELAMDREILKGPYRTTSTMIGNFDFKRKDGKLLFREAYHTSQSRILEGESVLDTDQSTTMWGDGQFVHTLSEGSNGRAVFKNKQTPIHVLVDSKEVLARLNRAYDLTLLPEEELLGEPVYVIQAVGKLDSTNDEKRRTVRYFSKKSGVLLKRVAINEDGHVTSTMRIGKTKFDPTFAEDHFVFVKPEGISIIDNTKE